MKRIKVRVNRRTGQITIKPEGWSGPACQEATKFLEDALGTKQSDERTLEFYEGSINQTQENVGG